jgi:hypothetical protein
MTSYEYWLLLQGSIVQSVPCTATTFWSIVRHLSPIHSWLSSSVLWQIPAETSSNESAESWQEIAVNFADEISLSYSAGFF